MNLMRIFRFELPYRIRIPWPGLSVMVLLALTSGTGWTECAKAQAGVLGPGAAFVGGGISGIKTGELDTYLAARGYPSFGGTARALSLGAYRILSNRLMLGAEFNGLIMGEEAHEGREVGLGGGYASLGIGYSVELSPRARIYPRLGIGVGGLGLSIENDTDPVGFDDVLADPGPAPILREPVLSRDGPVVDIGAGVEYLPSGRSGSALIGLRFGYLAAFFSSSWEMYERKANGGPDATISGPYIRAVVGGAWAQ